RISPRAFDRDHYDVPAHRYEEVLQEGAAPVSGGELVRVLAASGLRVTARERPERVRKNLLAGWQRLGAAMPGAEAAGWAETGERLLARWNEPHRSYHAPHHLAAVLRGVGLIER